MSIVRLPQPEGFTEEQKIHLAFDNGDLQALRSVLTKYGFASEEALLRFALFVLLKSEDNAVTVLENGTPSRYVPTSR